MKKFTEKVTSTKNFVVRHKTAFAVTGTAAVLITLNRVAIRDYTAFIAEKGLTEEYIIWMTSDML